MKGARGTSMDRTSLVSEMHVGQIQPPANSSSKSTEKSNKLTFWLIILSILVTIGIIMFALVLAYILVNGSLNGIYGPPSTTSDGHQHHQSLSEAIKKYSVFEKFFKVDRSSSSTTSSSSSSSSQVRGKVDVQSVLQTRAKRSPLTSSSSTFVEGSRDPTIFLRRYDDSYDLPRQMCQRRSLSICAGQVPYNATVYPNYIGDDNAWEAARSLPYYNYIARSRCNRRIKQLLCTLLEPPCTDGRPIPPCKKFCRIALEGCAEFVPATLELSAAFDCRRYPDSSDPNACVNLAMGKSCAHDEYHCPDKSCIPKHWVCDGVRDCIFAADEANCSTVACSSEEFQCDGKCVPLTWRCDGDRDCLDGSDEQACSYRPGCGPDRFKCSDGFGCIPKRWVCDGKAECRDGSDEVGCTQKDCTRGDFKCDNGICIPKIWLCDGQDDCKDNSDERSCSSPQSTPSNNHQHQQNQANGGGAGYSHGGGGSTGDHSNPAINQVLNTHSAYLLPQPAQLQQQQQTLPPPPPPPPQHQPQFSHHSHHHQNQQQTHLQSQSQQHHQQHQQQQHSNHQQQQHSNHQQNHQQPSPQYQPVYQQRPSIHSIGPYMTHNNIYRWIYK